MKLWKKASEKLWSRNYGASKNPGPLGMWGSTITGGRRLVCPAPGVPCPMATGSPTITGWRVARTTG